jgi:ABC-type uncharacterized transport system ATPase subunit
MAKRARKTYERGKMLKITNLHAAVDGKEILKGFDIAVEPGEIHAVMAPTARASRPSPTF